MTDGALVAQSKMTGVETSRPPRTRRHDRALRRQRRLVFGPLTMTDFVRYQGASGDMVRDPPRRDLRSRQQDSRRRSRSG